MPWTLERPLNNDLTHQLQELDLRFYQLSLRERLLVVVAGLIGIGMLGFVLFIEPIMQEADRIEQQQVSRTQALSQLERSITDLESSVKADPDSPLRDRLARANSEIVDLDNRLSDFTEELVPADKMPLLLEKVLSRSGKLKLVSLQSIAPVQLLEADPQQGGTNVNLYQHGVRLVLEGGYFEVQKYLAEVEALPWRFYWKVFNYQVKAHPQAKVELELYTLSTSAAFIGVGRYE